MRLRIFWCVVVAVGANAGCFDPDKPDIAFQCGPGGACPDDYECRDDGCCHLVGSPADETCISAVDAMPDADVTDAAPGDAMPDGMADAALPDAMPDAMPDAVMADAMVDAGPAPTLTALSPQDQVLTAGTTGMLAVRLSGPAPSGGVTVDLDSTAAGVASVPAQVTVLAGETEAEVTVTTGAAGEADITASLDGIDRTATITVAAATAGTGDVIINELVAIGPATGEWIELVNTSAVTIDLAGWTVDVDGMPGAILAPSQLLGDPVHVPPGGIVYGIPNPADPGDIPPGAAFVYGMAGTAPAMADTGSELTLGDAQGIIDVVDFTSFFTTAGGTPADGDFPGLPGRSTQLDARAVSNDDGNSWCVPATATPGAGNASCDDAGILEVLPDAFGSDDGAELIELAVVPGAHLSGLRVRTTDAAGVPGGLDVTLATGTRAPLDGFFVIADDTGGATTVAAADLETGFALPDAAGAVQLLDGAVLRDALGYGTLTATVDTIDGLALREGDAATPATGSSLTRDAQGTDTGDNASDFHLDPTPTPGQPADAVAPAIAALEPDDGLATTTAAVTLTGSDLITGAAVTVDGQPAACTVTAATAMDCVFPAHGGVAGAVDVAVTNPGGAGDTAAGAFVYTAVASQVASASCVLTSPLTLTVAAGIPTSSILGQVDIDGLTDTSDTAVGTIVGELGYGPDGSDPTAVNFTWTSTAPSPGYDFSADADEHAGTLTVPAAGTYDYAYRFSTDGGVTFLYCDADAGDAHEPADAGDLTVN